MHEGERWKRPRRLPLCVLTLEIALAGSVQHLGTTEAMAVEKQSVCQDPPDLVDSLVMSQWCAITSPVHRLRGKQLQNCCQGNFVVILKMHAIQ